MSGKRCRAFLITSNHPEKYYDWAAIDYAKAQPEDYEAIIRAAITQFVNGDKNHQDRDESINGAIGVFEIGESGTPHFHLLATSKNPMHFSAIQSRFSHSEIEPLRGNIIEAIDYLYKRGKYADKASTQKCQPVEWGECFVDNRGSDGSQVFDQISALLDEGWTPREINAQSPKLAFYSAATERTYNARKAASIPLFRDVTVEYHLGESASGKTYTYKQLCSEGLAQDVYLVAGDYEHPFDRYQNTERILFLDELRGNSFDAGLLLQICDGYPLTLPARYESKQAAWERVIIASIVPPEELFVGSFLGQQRSSQDTVKQFLRRIDFIVYHWLDPTQVGDEQYRSIKLPADQYHNINHFNLLIQKMISEGTQPCDA